MFFFKQYFSLTRNLSVVVENRVEKMGLSHIVKVIEHDVTASSLLNVVSGPGTVDVITMSYSYSMIPDQRAVVANAKKLLKVGGHLAIADFFLKGNYDDCLSPLFRNLRSFEAFFHKNWFAFDHVYLLEEPQLEIFDAEFETVWDKRFRGAVPFIPILNPFHGVRIMRKAAN